VRYNPYTCSVEIVDSKMQLDNIIQDIKLDLNLLQTSMIKISLVDN
jgi:hypothetical protein